MRKIVLIFVCFLLLISCQQAKEFEEPTTVVEEPEEVEVPEPVKDDNVRQEFEDLLNSKTDFLVTYNVKSVANGVEQTGIQRVAARGDDSKQSTDQDAMFVVAGEVFVCDTSQEVCYFIPQEEPIEDLEVSIPENVSVERMPSRNIAGVSASCYRIYSEGDDVEHCFDENGITIYFARNADGYDLEMEATSFSSTVPDSEFNLPYPVEELDPENFS